LTHLEHYISQGLTLEFDGTTLYKLIP
jgi:hypothetical protein